MRREQGLWRQEPPRGLLSHGLSLGLRLGLSLGLGLGATGCANQPPVIEQVGDFPIANSVGDYVDPSIVDSPHIEVQAGQTLVLPMTGMDPEGETLHWSAGPLPIGASFDEETGLFTWKVLNENIYSGSYELYVVLEDPEGAWDSVIIYLQLVSAQEAAGP